MMWLWILGTLLYLSIGVGVAAGAQIVWERRRGKELELTPTLVIVAVWPFFVLAITAMELVS